MAMTLLDLRDPRNGYMW